MFKISQIIFRNTKGEYLVRLRDNDENIPFPNTWDLIGGHIEKGETPIVALIREVKEEINFDLKRCHMWKKYVCLDGDVSENIKNIYYETIDVPIDSLTLTEGQVLKFVTEDEINNMVFANVIKKILKDFIQNFSQ